MGNSTMDLGFICRIINPDRFIAFDKIRKHRLKMKIQFNWGTGITVFIALFLLANAFVIYKSFQQKNEGER